MGRECGGEAPAGYFTLNYYSPPPKNSTKCPPMISAQKQTKISKTIYEQKISLRLTTIMILLVVQFSK
jgi:hypothetical protein